MTPKFKTKFHHESCLFARMLLMNKTLSFFLFCALFILSFPVFATEDTSSSFIPENNTPILVLNSTFGPPVSNQLQTGFADQLVTEALRRIGYQLELVRVPAERGLINANRGIEDGELTRIAGLQKKYTNLIQVPEILLPIDMVLFTKHKPDFKVNGWGSISSYSLAIISGWKIMEHNFGRFKDKIEIIKTDSAEQSFTLLAKNRVDFVAYSKWSGLGYLKQNNIHNIVLLYPPLASAEMYVYLHKKHKKIVPLLANAIAKMKEEGTVKKLYDELLLPYLAVNAKGTH